MKPRKKVGNAFYIIILLLANKTNITFYFYCKQLIQIVIAYYDWYYNYNFVIAT